MNHLILLPLAQLEPEVGVQVIALVLFVSLLVFLFRIDNRLTR